MRSLPLAVLFIATALAGCSSDPEPAPPVPPPEVAEITVEIPTMTNGSIIRPRYTCDGINLSPEVTWSGVPENAVTQALILNDPDAPDGAYIHWLVYDIPPDVRGFGEGFGKPFETTDSGAYQSLNSAGDLGYSGPCPPDGETHIYEISVYALDRALEVPPLTGRAEVLAGMEGGVIGYGVTAAGYRRIARFEEIIVFHLTPTP
ncbi:MAG: YbhB/YbcL family Raf kinase inhibitor-like protein [Chloroflexi bacterium]|nr:YbhB/YbcL family Raf kinase inhibitor-like protein [Chloroflexota bacterium]MDA1175307.1 YbhB/YbcL family Raf kinase inhibitor-like protein [Chloroflexota bacterium]